MKNLLYIRLHTGFGEWLRILNFEHTSQRDMPIMLEAFLCFLEANDCNSITEITENHLKNYLGYLSEQPCKTKEGTLSMNYIRKHLQVIRKFARYLSENGQESFAVKVKIKGKATNIKSILTKKEITKLYGATEESVLGLRDRALLTLFYGCGLRKSEGLNLNADDILLEKELVLVKRGKGYKARFVPLTGGNKKDLEYYLNYSRPYLLNGKKENALLLNVNGKRLRTAFERMQKMRSASGIKKPIGPHTLRHSIATHLLQSGMKLEQIQRFLGHSSLESTQIYTHIVHDLSLLVYQGISNAELHKLEAGHVKLKEGKLYVPASGQSNSRMLKLEAFQIMELYEYIHVTRSKILKEMASKERSGRKPRQFKPADQIHQLFISMNGCESIKTSLYHFNQALRKLNPKYKNAAQIRQCVITEWLKEKDLRTVQYMAGHKYKQYRTLPDQ